VVADTRAEALRRAEAMGATHTVQVGAVDLVEGIKEALDGEGADVTFEVTGVQAPLDAMGDVTRQSGKLVIVGYHQGGTRTLPLADWNWNAFQIVNAHFREPATIMRGMRVGMRLLTSGRLDIADLVTHRFPLENINDAFAVAHEKPAGFVKSTVVLNGSV
jgi:L-iditol 2-dehydrogenase